MIRTSLFALSLLMIAMPCSAAPYTQFDKTGAILSDNSSDLRKHCAYLVVDNNGKPALYPAIDEKTSIGQMSQLTKADLETDWKARTIGPGLFRIELVGWNSDEKKWDKFTVHLRFVDNACFKFRVSGNRIRDTHWISSSDVPERITSTKLSSAVPPSIVCAEGPRNTNP